MDQSPTKLSAMAFAGLRRLNPFVSHLEGRELIDAWMDTRKIYELGAINIFAGRNGSGKSTALELIEFLGNVDRICTLPRENRDSASHCFFQLWFGNEANLLARVFPNAVHEGDGARRSVWDWQNLDMLVRTRDNERLAFNRDIGKTTLEAPARAALQELVRRLDCRVSAWNPAIVPTGGALAEVLNSIAPHLSGLASDAGAPTDPNPLGGGLFQRRAPIVMDGNTRGYIGVYHSDDLRQFNHVQPAALPAGWRAAASLLHYFRSRQVGEMCLLEEPETHLHPALQRVIAHAISQFVQGSRLQVFIATHSMTFQSRFVWPESVDVQYFEADAHELHVGINERNMLDRLGVSGAELGTSNGVVWVEGPSDRLYYKHWIGLFCRATQTPEPLEHVDYCFAFHGGSILRHFAPVEGAGHVDISRLNRNFVVVVDKDLDGDEAAVDGSAKGALQDWVRAIGSSNCEALTTPGYTVESSLPRAFRDLYFEVHGPRLRLVRGRKVSIAERYCAAHGDWTSCFEPGDAMGPLVAALVGVINAWRR